MRFQVTGSVQLQKENTMKSQVARDKIRIIESVAAAIAAIVAIIAASPVQATITESSRWHLGEAGSVAPGTVGIAGLDSVNTDGAFNHFTHAFDASYLTASPPPATGSSAYLHVTAATSIASGTFINAGTPQTIPATNWGMEAWVRSTAAFGTGAFRSIMQAGDTGSGQLGIGAREAGGNVYWELDHVGIVQLVAPNNATTQVANNQWVNLAMINNAGTVELYVDGILAGSAADPPTVNNGNLSIGLQPTTGGFNFIGDIDELRFFTFGAGQFSADDLYINNLLTAPEPSTFVLLGLGIIGLAVRRRRARRA